MGEMITVDIESTGLDPRADRVTVVGVAIDDGDPIVLRHPADRELIQQLLDTDTAFLGHNLPFDLAFLAEAGYRIPIPERWHDSMLLAHTAGERRLGGLRLRRLTQPLIEQGVLPESTLAPEGAIDAWLRRARREARKQGARLPEKGDAPLRLLGPYLKADMRTTHAVAGYYGARLNGQQRVLDLERRLMPVVFAAEMRGVPLDLDAARELRDRTSTLVEDLRARLFELAGRPFNPNAARQLEIVLQERGADLSEVPRTPKTRDLQRTPDALELVDDDLARVWATWAKEKKFRDYVEGVYTHTHGDRLYGSFNQVGTDTGRMSSSRPNLQNIPKSDLRLRYVIAAGEGKVLAGADLDNMELRVLAAYAPGGALERAFVDGLDLHQQTADAVGIDRDLAKNLNFAITYGAGVPRVAMMLDVEQEEASEILDRWYGAYPEVAKLKNRLRRHVRRHGYFESIGGRRHYFGDGERSHLQLNYLIQGSAAEIFKAAMVRLHAHGVPLVLFVHDEVVAEVPEQEAEFTARLLEEELARGMGRVEHLVAQAQVAERWSDFKEPGWVPEE